MLKVIFCYLLIIFHFPYSPDSKLTLLNKEVPTLNYGGCGYFALKLYQKLDKNRYKLIVAGNFIHVLIEDTNSDSLLDSRGFFSQEDILKYYRKEYPHIYLWEISEQNLSDRVNDMDAWNTAFNRKDTIIINKFIESLK